MASTITVTFNTVGSKALQGNSFLRFRLRNFDGFVPSVFGSSILVETQIDAFPNSSGIVSQTLLANSAITPNTTFYTAEFWNSGRLVSSGNYLFNGSGDISNMGQLNAPPVPPGFLLVLENNGVLNSSQSTLNLESPDGSVSITDEGSGTLNLQVTPAPALNILSTAVTLTATQVNAMFNGANSVVIVPANGAGTYLNLCGVVWNLQKPAGASSFTNLADETFSIGYSSSVLIQEYPALSGIASQISAFPSPFFGTSQGQAFNTSITIDAPLKIMNLASGTQSTGGSGCSLVVTVYYTVVQGAV